MMPSVQEQTVGQAIAASDSFAIIQIHRRRKDDAFTEELPLIMTLLGKQYRTQLKVRFGNIPDPGVPRIRAESDRYKFFFHQHYEYEQRAMSIRRNYS